MNDNALKLENQLCHRLYTASNALTRVYRPVLKELGLTYPQYIVMMGLWENDEIAIHQLIEMTHLDGGSLTQILNKLKHKGLLKLEPSLHDRRQKLISLTSQGKRLKQQALKVPGMLQCKIDNFSIDEIKTLVLLMDKLNQTLL